MAKLKITLLRSTNNHPSRHIKTLAALGLHKIGHSVVQEDTPAIRGMIRQVDHMVAVEEV